MLITRRRSWALSSSCRRWEKLFCKGQENFYKGKTRVPKKLRVGVIFGGRSGEHEVSIRSARAIIESIDRKKFDVVPIAITKEGKWLSPAQSAQLLPAS